MWQRHKKGRKILDKKNKVQIQAAIEAILFAMGEAVEEEKIAKALELDLKTTRENIKELMERYNSDSSGIGIVRLENAYQMCTKKEMYSYLIRIVSQPKKHTLTDVLLETLSIIAYKQPVTKSEMESIRGVKCDHAVNKLIEYNLVEEVGRLDAPGRPLLFGTTQEFLRRFGVTSIEELPQLNTDKEEEFKEEAEKEAKIKLET